MLRWNYLRTGQKAFLSWKLEGTHRLFHWATSQENLSSDVYNQKKLNRAYSPTKAIWSLKILDITPVFIIHVLSW